MVISGDEGLDELGLAGGNDVAEVRGGETVAMRRISAADAGLPSYPLEDIRGGDPAAQCRSSCARCCRASLAPIAMRSC